MKSALILTILSVLTFTGCSAGVGAHISTDNSSTGAVPIAANRTSDSTVASRSPAQHQGGALLSSTELASNQTTP
jgi:hypothetical protein